jgi:HPt (histidine-containing phosphotransfer) domain-containing protein
VHKRDLTQAGALAHKLLSVARSVGARQLGDACAAIVHAGNTGRREALPELLALFTGEMRRVSQYIEVDLLGSRDLHDRR